MPETKINCDTFGSNGKPTANMTASVFMFGKDDNLVLIYASKKDGKGRPIRLSFNRDDLLRALGVMPNIDAIYCSTCENGWETASHADGCPKSE